MLRLPIIAILALIVICICLTFKAFPKRIRKIASILLNCIIAAPIFVIIYDNVTPMCCPPSCQNLLETEANNVCGKISSYFSDPDHTKTPTIDDLVHLEGYILPENRKSPRDSSFVKESDLIVSIRGEADDEIEIWVIARKGQCPSGKAFVYNMSSGKREWLKNYEEN